MGVGKGIGKGVQEVKEGVYYETSARHSGLR